MGQSNPPLCSVKRERNCPPLEEAATKRFKESFSSEEGDTAGTAKASGSLITTGPEGIRDCEDHKWATTYAKQSLYDRRAWGNKLPRSCAWRKTTYGRLPWKMVKKLWRMKFQRSCTWRWATYGRVLWSWQHFWPKRSPYDRSCWEYSIKGQSLP